MPKLFLFDLDDTLLRCNGAERRAFGKACEMMFGKDALIGTQFSGQTHLAILEAIFQFHWKRSPTQQEAEKLQSAYYSFFQDEIRPDCVVEKISDAENALAVCQTQGILGVVTGNSRVGAQMKLNRIGWTRKFLVSAFGCQSKNRVDLIQDAYQQAEKMVGKEFPRQEVFVIGDTPYDVSAARQAGVRSIGIATGDYSLHELSQSGADESYLTLGAWFSMLR